MFTLRQPFQKQTSGQDVFTKNKPFLRLKITKKRAGIETLGMCSKGCLAPKKSSRPT